MSQLAPGMARIRIKDLRLRTYIGIKEEEILNQQDILINATILYICIVLLIYFFLHIIYFIICHIKNISLHPFFTEECSNICFYIL